MRTQLWISCKWRAAIIRSFWIRTHWQINSIVVVGAVRKEFGRLIILIWHVITRSRLSPLWYYFESSESWICAQRAAAGSSMHPRARKMIAAYYQRRLSCNQSYIITKPQPERNEIVMALKLRTTRGVIRPLDLISNLAAPLSWPSLEDAIRVYV